MDLLYNEENFKVWSYAIAEMKFERSAAADLWRNTLSQIPTTFGRLIYLASLRDQNTGAYHHHGLEQLFGQEQAEQTLRQSHSQIFSDWLCFNLEQQKKDLEGYLDELNEDKKIILATWIRLCSLPELRSRVCARGRAQSLHYRSGNGSRAAQVRLRRRFP